MRISLTNNNFSFGRQLTSKEEIKYCETLKRAKEILGNTGTSALIVPVYSLPQDIQKNTGIGNLLEKSSSDFFDFAKKYWDINVVQLLPLGKDTRHTNIHPYSGSSLDLNEGLIDFESLTLEKYGKLISQEDFKELVKANSQDTNKTINYCNILTKNSIGEKLLKKAYKNFKENNTPAKNQLYGDFQQYIKEHSNWLNPKGIFEALKNTYGTSDYNKWNEIDKNLYSVTISDNTRSQRIKEIESKNFEDIEFYKFKLFLADKHLSQAKENLNKKGLQVSGDFLIGFSADEKWMNPSAFKADCTVNTWGSPALDFSKKEGLDFLKLKTKLFAKRYDKLRIDAGWWYIRQVNTKQPSHEILIKNYGEKILNVIEDEFKNQKKDLYKPNDIMYEFAANPETEFNMFNGYFLKPEIQNRMKIMTSEYLSPDYGNTEYYSKMGYKDSYILGVSNHDSKPLQLTFKNNEDKMEQIKTLAKILKIDKEKLMDFKEFKNAKYAEIMRAKNTMFFFLDILNIAGRYKDNVDRNINYTIKIPNTYKEDYFRALENNEGLNMMDAMDKAFVAKDLDKKYPEIYKQILKFNNILKSKEKKWYKSKPVIIIVATIIGLSTGFVLYHKNKSSSTNSHPNKI